MPGTDGAGEMIHVHRRRRLLVATVLSGCLGLGAGAAGLAQTFTITETEFAPGDMDNVVYRQINSNSGTPTVTAVQGTTGNPGPYRELTHFLPRDTGIGSLDLLTTPAKTYHPAAQGAISSLAVSRDAIIVQNLDDSGTDIGGGVVGSVFGLRQNGVLYFARAQLLSIDSRAFDGQALNGLTAQDFTDVNGNHPDFSETGGPIEFGFAHSNTRTGSGALLVPTYGYDNVVIVLGTGGVPVAVTPMTIPAERDAVRDATRAAHDSVHERMHGGHFCSVCAVAGPSPTPAIDTLRYGPGDSPWAAAPAGVYAADLAIADFAAAPPPRQDRWTVFGSAVYGAGSSEPSAGQAGQDYHLAGATIGIDRLFGPRLAVGAAFNFGRVDGTFDEGGGTNDVGVVTALAYAGWQPNEFAYLNGVVSYGVGEIDRMRNVDGLGSASGSTASRTFAASVRAGADVPLLDSPFLVGGSVSLDYQSTTIDAYTETSAGAPAFAVPEQHARSARLSVTGRLARPVERDWGIIVPNLSLTYGRELLDDGEILTVTAQNTGFTTGVTVDDPARDTLTLAGGVYASFEGGSSIGVSASTTLFNDESAQTTVSLRGRIRF